MKILFVCTGNICRSPTAHALALHKAKILDKENLHFFDSAGTSAYHAGERADQRSAAVGKKRGVSFAEIFSRQITKQDFTDFDFILCMDRSHVSRLLSIAEEKYHHKIKLFLEFCETTNSWDDEVIDPYYGAGKGFEEVFDLIDSSVENLFKILKFYR